MNTTTLTLSPEEYLKHRWLYLGDNGEFLLLEPEVEYDEKERSAVLVGILHHEKDSWRPARLYIDLKEPVTSASQVFGAAWKRAWIKSFLRREEWYFNVWPIDIDKIQRS